MRVQDVMTTNVKTIAPTAGAEDAWNLMRLHGIHHLVVSTQNRVIGVLSERDAGGRRGGATRMVHSVADLMTTPAVAVEPTTTVRQAANLMRGRSIGCVVVVKSDHVVGIVTVSDLLELIGRGIERGATAARRWTLKHRAPHRKAKSPAVVW